MVDITNIIFIKGGKQPIVDFINRGLEGCNSKVRFSADMSGAMIADRLNGHGCPITMHSYLPNIPYVPMDLWNVKYETKDNLCLSFQLIDAPEDPTPFLRFINEIEGLTVYAYGFDSPIYSLWYQYDGQQDEVIKKNVMEDMKATNSDAAYTILEGYVKDFLQKV